MGQEPAFTQLQQADGQQDKLFVNLAHRRQNGEAGQHPQPDHVEPVKLQPPIVALVQVLIHRRPLGAAYPIIHHEPLIMGQVSWDSQVWFAESGRVAQASHWPVGWPCPRRVVACPQGCYEFAWMSGTDSGNSSRELRVWSRVRGGGGLLSNLSAVPERTGAASMTGENRDWAGALPGRARVAHRRFHATCEESL